MSYSSGDFFLCSGLTLDEHEYVKQCQKLCSEVKLVLVEKPLRDDADHNGCVTQTTLPGIAPTISQQEMNNLLNSYYAKEGRVRSILLSHTEMVSVSTRDLTQLRLCI